MLESEAKTKWCPFVRFTVYGNDRDSNRSTDVGETNCIASDCMAWRWVDEHDGFKAFVQPDGSVITATTMGIIEQAKKEGWKEYRSEHGYCGLAK